MMPNGIAPVIRHGIVERTGRFDFLAVNESPGCLPQAETNGLLIHVVNVGGFTKIKADGHSGVR